MACTAVAPKPVPNLAGEPPRPFSPFVTTGPDSTGASTGDTAEEPPPRAAGAASVYSGGALLAGLQDPWARYEGRWIFDDVGMTVGGADLDGDGDTEIVVGARAWWSDQDQHHSFVLHPVAGVTLLGDGEGPSGCMNGVPVVEDIDGDAVPDALCDPPWPETEGGLLSGATLPTAMRDTTPMRYGPNPAEYAGDLDQDGWDELMIGNAILPDGPWVGTLSAADARLTVDGIVRSRVDLDGDGGAELFVDGDPGEDWLYPSQALRGTGQVGIEVALPTFETWVVGVGDVDGDGLVDLMASGIGDLVDLVSGADLLAGTRTALASIDLGPGGDCSNAAAARDVDGDGRPELVLVTCGAETWLFRGADLPTDGSTLGVADEWVRIPMSHPGVGALAWVDDLDGDTLPDLVVGDPLDRQDAPDRNGIEEPCANQENAGDPAAAPVLALVDGWVISDTDIELALDTSDPDGDLAGVGRLRVFLAGVPLFDEPGLATGETPVSIPIDAWGIPRGLPSHLGFLVEDAAGNSSDCVNGVLEPD